MLPQQNRGQKHRRLSVFTPELSMTSCGQAPQYLLDAGVTAAQLLIPAELSHDAIDAIGEIGQLQFKDLNADKSVFQRTYANQVGAGRLPHTAWRAISQPLG